MSNEITPKIDGSKIKVLHEDKRTDVESGIIGRSASRRIERAQEISNKVDGKLLKLMNSRFKRRLRES